MTKRSLVDLGRCHFAPPNAHVSSIRERGRFVSIRTGVTPQASDEKRAAVIEAVKRGERPPLSDEECITLCDGPAEAHEAVDRYCRRPSAEDGSSRSSSQDARHRSPLRDEDSNQGGFR